MMIGKPILNVGIKNPYMINKIQPDMLTRRNFFTSFIVKDNNTINDAKYPTYSVPVIPNNSILFPRNR
ncbi:hypothetical protein SAMN05444148_0270 [Winogradskyella jejuensis]|uniref:Uncharacterized protein n=1 Tax=Winogradskyella jejuensis TaxID=1089305 RepID=A0A1M5KAW6_9FLAO|nr:hypothetical protein SAMN05444148_0270 [Winogradskyella jejuensis]